MRESRGLTTLATKTITIPPALGRNAFPPVRTYRPTRKTSKREPNQKETEKEPEPKATITSVPPIQ